MLTSFQSRIPPQSFTPAVSKSAATRRISLQLAAQHTIEGKDLMAICAIALQETHLNNIYEQIETWQFEQFFGLACHLFITTKSTSARRQLADLLPKFGSIAVFSLLTISYKFNAQKQSQKETKQLAIHSLKEMPLPALVVGITNAIEEEEENSRNEFLSKIVPTLIALAAHHQAALLSELAKQLTPQTWNALQSQLLRALSEAKHTERFSKRERRIKVRLKSEQQTAEVAC